MVMPLSDVAAAVESGRVWARRHDLKGFYTILHGLSQREPQNSAVSANENIATFIRTGNRKFFHSKNRQTVESSAHPGKTTTVTIRSEPEKRMEQLRAKLAVQPKSHTPDQCEQRRKQKRHQLCRTFGTATKKHRLQEQQLHCPSKYASFKHVEPEKTSRS